MEYYFHVWTNAPRCYLEMLDMLQKTAGPSLAATFESLAHRQNLASLSLFYRCYFGRRLSELAQPVPLSYSRGRSTCYSHRLHNFFIIIPRYNKDVCVKSFFSHSYTLEFSAFF